MKELLTPSPPPPDSEPHEPPMDAAQAVPVRPSGRLDPTRYGDWEINGKCVDF